MSLLRTLGRPVTSCSRLTRTYAAKAPTTASSSPNSGAGSATTPEADAKSACPPNTLLPGLNWLKGQEPVIALPDDQYPDWLWTALEPRKFTDEGPGSKAEKYSMRKERRQSIRDQNFMKTQ